MPKRADYTNALASSTLRLSPPKDLDPAEAAVFVQLVGTLPPSHFETSDLPMLELYCRCVVAERLAHNELNAAMLDEIARRLAVWTARARMMGVVARRLRINPSGRAEIRSSNEAAAIESDYDKLRMTGWNADAN